MILTCTHTHTLPHSLAHKTTPQAHTHTHTLTHTQIHTHTHIKPLPNPPPPHTHGRTHTRTRSLTHIHTYTQPPHPTPQHAHTHTIRSNAHSHLAKFQVPLLHRVVIIDSNVDLFLGWNWTDRQCWGLWWASTAGLGGVQMRVAWKRDSQSVKSPVTWGRQDKPQRLGNTGQTSMTGEHRTNLNNWGTQDKPQRLQNTGWTSTTGEHRTNLNDWGTQDKPQWLGNTGQRIYKTPTERISPNYWEYICLSGWGTQDSWEYICLSDWGTQVGQRIYLSTWHTARIQSQLPQWLGNTGYRIYMSTRHTQQGSSPDCWGTSTSMAGEHRTDKGSTSVHDTHSQDLVSTVGSTSASMAGEHRADKGSTSVHDIHSKNRVPTVGSTSASMGGEHKTNHLHQYITHT